MAKLSRRTAASAGLAALSVCLGLGGCNRNSSSVREGEGAAGSSGAEMVDDAVAVVDGRSIALSELRELLRRSELSAREALDRLVSERLLMREARRRGFAEDPEVQLVAKRAAVQALLTAEADKLGVEEQELREAYEAAHNRFHVPEKRETIHLLAKIPADAAPELSRAGQALVREAIDALSAAELGEGEVEPILRRFRERNHERFPVTVEKLPAFARIGRLVKEYEDAMFEPSKPGVVLRPVRTSYGWHAIYVSAIHPEQHWSFGEVSDRLRAEILLEKRTEWVESFIDRLRKDADIRFDESAVEWLLQVRLPVLDRR